MQFRILGSLEVVADGVVADLGPPKQRAVLAILLMHAGEIVSVDRLIELLWGEGAPRTAAHSIQIYVSELRKALEPLAGARVIATRQPGYQLESEPDTIDAWQFERLVSDGVRQIEGGERDAGAAALRTALALWRGPALSEFAYEEFAQPYIRRLHDLHLDAIEVLAAAELAAGRTTEVLPLLDAAIREDPLRERSRELQMLALYRSGRHAEALRSYQRFRALLVEEMGLDPSPPLQRMQERILLHDPTLMPAVEAAQATDALRNPYKGLRPFAEADAPDFFGRQGLLERVLDNLRAGARLVALVGPSGSGKSSLVAAGVLPSLRAGAIDGSDRWLIAPLVLGANPLQDVESIISKAAGLPVGLAPLLGQGGETASKTVLRTMPDDGRLVLVIDQFEDLFSVAEETARRQFLGALAAAVSEPGGQVIVLLTMRADFYDRPLLHQQFAEVFIPAVINVLPMSAGELEAAIVRPAERVGVNVEPALLAELVAETADQTGALPLLQYALTELFEQKTGGSLTLAGYRALGSLKGVLSRRAESVYAGLTAGEKRTATQLFLRLVRLGRGPLESRRRLPLDELTDLDIDPVLLSEVLSTFARHRLLSFDRDQVTGVATVEVAHEALLREWDRLAGWIDRYRAALRRHETFAAAVEEWELAGRHDDYLLAGGRLAEFEAWSREGTLELTTREREFLAAGVRRREAEAEQEEGRREAQRRLEGRARFRLAALGVAIALLVGAVVYGAWVSTAQRVPRVALLHQAQGGVDFQFEDGFDRAVSEFGVVASERIYDDPEKAAEDLRSLAVDGADLILLDARGWDPTPVIREFPRTRFDVPFPIDEPNVSYTVFADQEGAFLAGAAAALVSKSGTVGFVGGMDDWYIWPFHAGYEAGAMAVDPQVRVVSTYLTDDLSNAGGAFDAPVAALEAAREMYEDGADVVFHAAGDSGIGVFEAAVEMSTDERHLWAIGVDTDQFETVGLLRGAIDPTPWRWHILTSMIKRLDVAAYVVVEEFSQGEFKPGARRMGLEAGVVDLSYSGRYLDDVRPQIEALRAQINSGSITVPCVPPGRVLGPGFVHPAC